VSDVNANIGIHFDTSDALAQLRRLQAGLSRFNQALTEGNVAAANAQKGLNSQLMQSINATGKFVASQKTIASSTTAFTDSLEKNKLSMGQYFRYTAAAATMNSKTLKGLFAQEKDVLKRAMKDRVKTLQTQYVQLTNANGEFVKVLQVVPKHLKMVNGQYADYATRTQMAAQRQQFLNQLLKQGSTQLLNFGKNTQWAGRQLMVGLTIPLTILGSAASKVFREMEMAVVKFTRVYGDMNTSMGDTDRAVAEIQVLAKEFTKFGIAAKDTMEMAASAAAMGLTGTDLMAQVTQATRLAVLGQVEQAQALETTISLQNAFGISAEQLAGKINYLNAVENQTVLSIEDLTIAIPKAGPVVKQLGGSVEDLAFFMTAMKEGGINASEGANALKSGLASMINPSKKSAEFLAQLGINIKGIVNANAGDLKNTVIGFAQALDTLDPLNRARAIEQLFGKFQFARLSTLFQNVSKDGSQASRALGLAGASVEELAILSERELGKVENAVGVKFQKTIEQLKLELVPIGKAFLEAVTPIAQFVVKILGKFNNLSDGTKKFVVGFIGVIGGIAPVVLMTVGLVANGVANLIKFFAMLRSGVAKLNGQNNVLGGGFDYLTQAETENLAQTHALHLSHKDLISTFNVEKASVEALAAAYQNAASQARALASGSPSLFNAVPGPKGAVSGLPKFANGKVPGNESEGDSILALVAPGETIVPVAQSKKYGPLLKAIMGDDLPGFETGRYAEHASQADRTYAAGQAAGDTTAQQYIENEFGRIRNLSKAALIKYAEATGKDISDTSAAGLKAIRDSIISDFKTIIAEVKEATGRVTEETIASIGKRFDPETGTTRMGTWAPKFNQPYGPESAHVGQTEKLRSSQVDLIPEAKAQLDAIQQWFKDQGRAMPELRVADAHMFTTQGNINNAMSEEGKAKGYEERNGVGSLGKDLETDFAARGVEKWREMTVLTGNNFDELKSQAEVYDNALQQRLREWNEEQQRKIAQGQTPELMTDDVFAKLEYEVRDGIKSQIPEWNAVIEQAKRSITEIRISVGKDFDALNAHLKSQGLGSLGTDSSNSKILNSAARLKKGTTNKVDGKILGTQPLHEQGDVSSRVSKDLDRAEEIAETKSPSKRTERLGVNIGEGLRIGLERKTGEVKSQADQLAEASIPKVDTANQAKYDAMKNDPEQRQIQKSIDRHYRDKFGSKKVPVPTSSESTDTSVTVDIDPKALMSDMSAIKAARQKAKQLEKEAADAEAAAAKIRTEAAKWEEIAAREKGENMHTAENARDLKKLADEAEIRAAEARIKAAEAERVAADLESGDGSTEQTIQDPAKTPAKVKKAKKVIAQGTVEQGDGIKRIVDGTEDTADSTLLVADQTDEIATITEDIIPAQTDNLDNVITTSNLNDAIVGTTGDIHGSTIETAEFQEDIVAQQEREKFLREQMNGELAKQNAALAAGSDLSQTGKKRYTKDQALAEAYGDGTAENPGYTMDKNGHLLFDPELDENGKKQPTTMNEKQIKKKKRGMRRATVGKYSGKATGVLGMATMAAGAMGAPPQVTAALGTAATVAQFAPMLAGMGPVGWAAAGIMAVGAGAYMLNKHFSDMAKAAAKFAKATAASTDKMSKVGEITGQVGSSQIMSRKNKNSLYQEYNEVSRKGTEFGNKFLKSDVGKDIQKAVSENMVKNGNEVAAKDLARQLAYYVSDGVMTGEQANSVAQQIGINLKDQVFSMKVKANIISLIGSDGNDLFKDPIEARVNLIAETRANVDNYANEVNKYGNNNVDGKEAATIQAMDATAIQLAQAQADAVQRIYLDKKRALEIELESTTNLAKKAEIEEQIETLNKQNIKDMARMNEQVGASIALAEDRYRNIIDSDKLISGRESGAFDASRAAVTNAYAGTASADAAKKFLDRSDDFGDYGSGFTKEVDGQAFQYKMEMMVGNKMMTPEQANAMLDTFAGSLPELDAIISLGVKTFGSAETMSVLNMFSGFQDKTVAKELIASIMKKDKKEFDETAKTIASLQMLSGQEVDVEVVLTTIKAEGLQIMTDRLKEIEEWDDTKLTDKEVTIKTITEFAEKNKINSPELQEMMKQPWFLKMKPGEKREVIQKYTQLHMAYAVRTPAAILADAEAQAKIDLYKKYGKIDVDGVHKLEFEEWTSKYVTTYNNVGGTAASATTSIYKTDDIVPPKVPGDDIPEGTEVERDTTYDELMKRLRNVRNSAIDAAGGFKELQRAIAATGSKAIANKFQGLEQQLIKMGQTSQFTDYLAGLDTKDLKKFAYTATAADVKKKKGKQKYTQVDPETGKMVTKYQKFKAGDTVLTQKGRDMEQGYKKAIIGDYNKAQLQSVTLAKQEIAARGKLLALGFDELDIQTMLADENYKTLIATGKVTKAELETNAALTKQARIRNQINGAVAGQKDLQKTTANQKRIPEVVAMMQQAGMNAQSIREAIKDPAMLDTLINGMDNFGTLAKDAQDEFNHLLSQINEIPERKIIEIIFTQTREEKIMNAATAAAEMFDAYKMIDENTLTNKEGNTFAGLQVKMEDLNNQSKIAQNAINLTQSKIDDMQKEVDADQRKIEEDFTRPIEKKQREIDKLTRSAELNFTRPIQALQERSAVLSHDLDVMNKAAEAINEKYDKQQEALTKVSEINQQIISQQQQQLGLADALSQGDISGAAKAIQDMRASNAANYATSAQDALQKARENEVGSLRGGVSGKSQKEIEAEQWDISQKTYDLELKKAAVDKEILAIQDSIYTLEQSRQVALDAIQVKTDAIAKITFGTLLDQQNKLKAINDQSLELTRQSDLLAYQITQNDKNRIIQGQTRAEWDLTYKAADAAAKLAKGDLAAALAGVNSVSGTIKGAWDSIKSSYDDIKDKSITITQHIVTTYGAALGLPDPNAGKPDPNAGKPDPTKSPGAAWISDGKGGWKQPTKPTGDYGWDDNKGWVKGYYGSTVPVTKTGGTNDSASEVNLRAAALLATSKAAAEKAERDLAARQAEYDSLMAGVARLRADGDHGLASAAMNRITTKYPGGRPSTFAKGGLVDTAKFLSGKFSVGRDTVPAMLSPGEFVMSKYAVDSYGVEKMKAINSGTSVGDSVYNYNLSVNVKSDANPDQIARTIIAQIQQIDSQRMRGTRI